MAGDSHLQAHLLIWTMDLMIEGLRACYKWHMSPILATIMENKCVLNTVDLF